MTYAPNPCLLIKATLTLDQQQVNTCRSWVCQVQQVNLKFEAPGQSIELFVIDQKSIWKQDQSDLESYPSYNKVNKPGHQTTHQVWGSFL